MMIGRIAKKGFEKKQRELIKFWVSKKFFAGNSNDDLCRGPSAPTIHASCDEFKA
jgi:hypothetical protein